MRTQVKGKGAGSRDKVKLNLIINVISTIIIGTLLRKDQILSGFELFRGDTLKEAQLSAIIIFKDRLSAEEFANLLGKMTFNAVCVVLICIYFDQCLILFNRKHCEFSQKITKK